jgi:hypothetical protein
MGDFERGKHTALIPLPPSVMIMIIPTWEFLGISGEMAGYEARWHICVRRKGFVYYPKSMYVAIANYVISHVFIINQRVEVCKMSKWQEISIESIEIRTRHA